MANWNMVVSTLQHGEKPTASGVFTRSCLSDSITKVPIALNISRFLVKKLLELNKNVLTAKFSTM